MFVGKQLKRMSSAFNAKPKEKRAPESQQRPAAASSSVEQEETKKEQAPETPPKRVWRSARDPKTGRTYYYDVVTRETQWNKPLELLDPEERADLERREAEKRSFFDEMERNMRRRFGEGLTSVDVDRPVSHRGIGWRPPRATSGSYGNSFVRTLSTMDDSFLDALGSDLGSLDISKAGDLEGDPRRPESLRKYKNHLLMMTSTSRQRLQGQQGAAAQQGKDDDNGFPPTTTGTHKQKTPPPHEQQHYYEKQHEKGGEKLPATASAADAARNTKFSQRHHPRHHRGGNNNNDTPPPEAFSMEAPTRNSTGTLYVEHTLDHPDREATIRCVCHVIRAHVASTASPGGKRKSVQFQRLEQDQFLIFHDDEMAHRQDPPTAKELVNFYRDVFSRGQMELECIVTSLIYVERLLKAARGKFRLRPTNWRPTLLASMIMASKVCDDLSMWNADFSHITTAFDLQRINALEAALLKAYGYNATVAASEYAKYFFHLRSMAARLGLGEHLSDAPKPLDVQTAKQVAARSRRRFPNQEKDTQKQQPETDHALSSGLQPAGAANGPFHRAASIGVDVRVEEALKAAKPRPAILEDIVDMAPQATP